MYGEMQAIIRFHGKWGVNRVDLRHPGFVEQMLITIQLIGTNPPAGVIAGQIKFRYFIRDHKILQSLLLRPFVAETQTVIKQTKREVHLFASLIFCEIELNLPMMIPYLLLLAPGLGPGLIMI